MQYSIFQLSAPLAKVLKLAGGAPTLAAAGCRPAIRMPDHLILLAKGFRTEVFIFEMKLLRFPYGAGYFCPIGTKGVALTRCTSLRMAYAELKASQ